MDVNILDIVANPIVAIIGIVLAILALMLIAAKRYVTVTPNVALIVSGRRKTRVVVGGGTLVLPVVETAKKLSLELMTVDLKKENVYTKTGVPVDLTGVVQFRVGDGEEAIRTASKTMLGQTREQIRERLEETLDGHMRAICGNMTPVQLVTDRDAFSQQVVAAAADDLAKMGFIINSLTIKDLSDKVDYYKAWGTPEIQNVLRDAKIATAEADKEARQRAALAQQAAVKQEQESAAKEAEFIKAAEIKKAEYKKEVETERAIAEQANPIETAKQKQKLKEEEMKISIIEQEKTVEVTEKKKKVRENEGEAEKLYRVKVAEAQAIELENKGKGEGFEVKSRQEGEAEGCKKLLTAEADGNKAKLLAEAEGTKAKLLAEAEGIEKRAEALKKLNEAGLQIEVLKVLPQIVEAFSPVVGAAGEAAGRIGNVTVIQTGDAKDAPTSPVTNSVMDIVTKVPPILAAYGIDIAKILRGDTSDLQNLSRSLEDKSGSQATDDGGDGGKPPSAPTAEHRRPKKRQAAGRTSSYSWNPETQTNEDHTELQAEEICHEVMEKISETAENVSQRVDDAREKAARMVEKAKEKADAIDDRIEEEVVRRVPKKLRDQFERF